MAPASGDPSQSVRSHLHSCVLTGSQATPSMLGDMSGEVRVPWFAMEKHSTLGQQKPEEDMLPPYLPRGGLHSNPTVALITI